MLFETLSRLGRLPVCGSGLVPVLLSLGHRAPSLRGGSTQKHFLTQSQRSSVPILWAENKSRSCNQSCPPARSLVCPGGLDRAP